MNTKEKMDVLSEYLSDSELKEVAKSAAYDLFKGSIGADNPSREDNVRYYATQGAMLAMEEAIAPVREDLQETYNARVKGMVRNLSIYTVLHDKRYCADEMINSALNLHKDKITAKIDLIMKGIVEDDEKTDSLYLKFNEMASDAMGDLLYNMLEAKFNKKE